MAGIGFSLKRLFHKKGFFAVCRAYGYAGIICCGPMILGVILLWGMSMVARLGGLDGHDRELLNALLTYSLLASLAATSWLNMVVTRYVSDMLYMEKKERIIPSLYGSCTVLLVFGGGAYGIFLLFSGVAFLYKVLCFWFAAVLIVVWIEMIYLTALKDYKGILQAFVISLMCGFLMALIFVIMGIVTVESLMLCVILAYGMLMVWYYILLIRYFPESDGSKYSFVRWLGKYKSLAFNGGFVNIGLFGHMVLMYFGPLRVQVEGLFYGAPLHDIPALMAFCSVLITTINFVTSVEVRFYPKYREYYSLFNDHGAIRDIMEAEEEMLVVLEQELTVNAQKQLFTSIFFVVFGRFIMSYSDMGMNDLALGIFMFLCVGYGLYAISNSNMLILLYFEDYTGAFWGTAAFAFVSVLATAVQILFGSPQYFGIGFVLGNLAFYLVIWIRLEWYTRQLPYFLLCRQQLVEDEETGWFWSFCRYLEQRDQRRYRREMAHEKFKKKAD